MRRIPLRRNLRKDVESSSASPARRRRAPRESNEVRLDWPGRAASMGNAPVDALSPTLIPVERGAAAHRIVQGDALDVARALLHETRDRSDASDSRERRPKLIYVDPPFASQSDYVHEARLDGSADGRVVRTLAYEDKWHARGVTEYLDQIAPRLAALAELLADGGTLWVHLDWRAAYLVRVLLDEMLGRDAFLNEIVWRRAPNLGRQAASAQFGRTLDTIVVYAKGKATLRPPTRLEPIEPSAIRWDADPKEGGRPFTTAPRGDYTDASIEKLDKEGRVHRTASGKVYIKYFLVRNAEGVLCRERRVDALWTDVPPLRHAAVSERTGFPTQKPRALLDRIVTCATEPGDRVVDVFGGSGTSAESAFALGREFVIGDAGSVAIATARARLLRAGCDVRIDRVAGDESAATSLVTRVRFARADDGRVLAFLDQPSEPLAWAIDAHHDAALGFQRDFHAERGLGARPAPCARQGAFVWRGGLVAVRVFGVDGSVASDIFEPADVAAAISEGKRA